MPIVTVSPTNRIPSPLALSGSDPVQGVTLAQLEGWYKAVCAAIADPRERETARVIGTEHLAVQYEHALTPRRKSPSFSASSRSTPEHDMRKAAILTLSILASTAACAVDVTQTLTITHAGAPVLDSNVHFLGMTQAQADQLAAKGNKFLDAVRAQGKMSKAKGAYSIVLDGSTKGDDGKVAKGPLVSFDGLTLSDMNKVMRANAKYIEDLIGESEQADKA